MKKLIETWTQIPDLKDQEEIRGGLTWPVFNLYEILNDIIVGEDLYLSNFNPVKN